MVIPALQLRGCWFVQGLLRPLLKSKCDGYVVPCQDEASVADLRPVPISLRQCKKPG